MNRKLIWAAAVPTFCILISGIVLLSGTQPHQKEQPASIEPPRAVKEIPITAQQPAPTQSVSTEADPFEPVEFEPFDPAFTESAPRNVDDILNTPIEDLILADNGFRTGTQSAPDAAARSPLLSGISIGLPGNGEPLALAELDIDSLLGDAVRGTSQPDAEAEESTVGTIPDHAGDKPDDADVNAEGTAAGAGDKKDDDEGKHDRITVSLIKPKGEAVRPQDEVIVRSRAKGLTRAFVMVRARQKDAPWWVQQEAIRNGAYFRARAQFGNAKTLDGTRFRMVVAFAAEKDEVPEAGVFFHDIPLNYTLSEEFDVTLNK